MVGYADNQFFKGKIDGKKLRDFNNLDKSKKTTNERIEEVNNLLEDSDFFVDYLSDSYKSNINSNEATSENVNVHQALERMASYILNSEEEIELRNKQKPEYVFVTNIDKFNRKINRETVSMISSDGILKNITESENIVYAQKAKKTNYRLPKIQVITKRDLNMNNKCGQILREYQMFLDHVTEKMQGDKDKLWRRYSNAKGQVKDDMINTKNMLMGVWGFNTKNIESSSPDLDVFDFTDFNTIKYMIKLRKPDLLENEDMWITWNDFFDTVQKANLTPEEYSTFVLLQRQYSMTDIAEILDIDWNRIRRTVVGNIVKKIAKVGNKYDAYDEKIREKIEKRKEKAKIENEGEDE